MTGSYVDFLKYHTIPKQEAELRRREITRAKGRKVDERIKESAEDMGGFARHIAKRYDLTGTAWKTKEDHKAERQAKGVNYLKHLEKDYTNTNEYRESLRVSAADALGTIPSDPAALASALEDGSPKVRVAVIGALGKLRATSQASKIRDRLDDTKEDVEVRALAARTLGILCVQSAADRLTKLALLARQPVDAADDQIGTAAIDALSNLHPNDIEKRLAPLREKGVRPLLKRAAERAIAEQGTCR
jgi:HEAT repeat protein